MEQYEPETQENYSEAPSSDCPKIQRKLIELKKYEIKYEQDIYLLIIEMYSDDNICFKLRKNNNLSLYQYTNKYSYNDMIKLFLLQKEYYNDMSKIYI